MKNVALSAKDIAFLRGVAQDKTYAQIAADLGKALETIKARAKRLRCKLNIKGKVGLALFAANHLNLR